MVLNGGSCRPALGNRPNWPYLKLFQTPLPSIGASVPGHSRALRDFEFPEEEPPEVPGGGPVLGEAERVAAEGAGFGPTLSPLLVGHVSEAGRVAEHLVEQPLLGTEAVVKAARARRPAGEGG